MDPRFNGFPGSINGINLTTQSAPLFPNTNLINGPLYENAFVDHSFGDYRYHQGEPTTSHAIASNSGFTHEENPPEDCDFSDAVLQYISQILMEEEDLEDQTCTLQESLNLQTAERSLYEAIGKKYPPSPEQKSINVNCKGENLICDFPVDYMGNNIDSGYLIENSWVRNPEGYHNASLQPSHTRPITVSSVSQSSYGSSNSIITYADKSMNSTHHISDINSESQSVWLFKRGVEEASKFLPGNNRFLANFGFPDAAVKEGNEEANKGSDGGFRGRKKKPSRDDGENVYEERRNKVAAAFPEPLLRSEPADKILVHIPGGISMQEFDARREVLKNGVQTLNKIIVHIPGEKDMEEFDAGRDALDNGIETLDKILVFASGEKSREEFDARRIFMKNGVAKNLAQDGRKAKGSRGRRDKRRSEKKEVFDLRTLLIHCAQAVAADDPLSANELIKQIKKHASPFGDGNERLAYCFVESLEARLAGTGSQTYKNIVCKPISAADILKAYHLFLCACPFRKVSNFVTNKTINCTSATCVRIHVIDFGILYGFQWPTFIQRLSQREGGPPKLRITGIDFPQPGFRPARQVEETGRRLAAYAEEYRVPFEYHAIAKKWETIKLDELKIDRDEFLVVSCLYRGKNLHDETVTANSARDRVLSLIRQINPDLFIHGIINGAYNAPFFVTRFREALFHFSSIFDMLETIVPREDTERMLLEKEVFGREALNVIACEGWERVERPETYKQWQVRIVRSGFVQVPFAPHIVQSAFWRVRTFYHKDFVIDEDRNKWLLQGWKGRIIFALSAWKPSSKA